MAETNDDSTSIAQRIEKLNRWQEEQRQILLVRQINQRKLLTQEQKTMYKMLGIMNTDPNMLEVEEITDDASDCETFFGVSTLDPTMDGDREKENLQQNDQILKLNLCEKPKRPFLKRKQGIMNRFKLDPDQFRLSNLPPYKFASSHPSLSKTLKKITEVKNKSEESEKKDSPRPVPKSLLKLKGEGDLRMCSSLDLLEEKFQNSLISSQTACNSTPDIKVQSSCKLSKKQVSEPISWATILDPQNIKPVDVHDSTKSSHQETRDEKEAMSIFELLEEKAKEGSFDMDSSCIQRLLKKCKTELDDVSLASSIELKLGPVPTEIYRNTNFVDSDFTDEENEPAVPQITKPQSQVRFADNVLGGADDSVCTEDTACADHISSANDTASADEMGEADTTQNLSEQVVDSINSTVNGSPSQVFEDFKKMLFANADDAEQTTSRDTLKSELSEDMLKKADLIKDRLRELEMEIASFKENNQELVKSKQQHELEKAHFEQERKDSVDQLNDERMQMEIYLHDERMKIEDERKRFEKQVRTQKTLIAMQQKKESVKLREDLENLQKELKKKNEAHILAQNRLRLQIRNQEKDIRQLNLDIENLTKANKRLEAENNRLNRHNNNKLLQEINKNIAKLGPKTPLPLPGPAVNETSSDKLSNSIQARPKRIARRRCPEVKVKPVVKKQIQNSPVTSSTEESTSTSLTDTPPSSIKVTFANFLTPTNDKKLKKGKEETKTIPAASADTAFKREITNADGSKDIWYPNGNIKKVSADGMNIRMLYFNKDIKETNINEGTVKYYYAETNTWHTTYIDGLEILEFPNGQTEHRYKDGRIEVHFPNNSVKLINPSDEHKLEEWRFADGTNLIQMRNGDKVLLLSNGQKEIHTPLNKRREYPDGTVKLVYPDGSQETRYSNGRVRLKDKEGNLLMDTHIVMQKHRQA